MSSLDLRPSGQRRTIAHTGTYDRKSNFRRSDVSYCSPVATNRIIYYQLLSGALYAINEADGRMLAKCFSA